MKLALAGAFPFPAPQGSQRYLAQQGEALARAGHEVTLYCYGSGDGRAPSDRLRVVRTPRRISPNRIRAGLSPAKPLADLALAGSLLRGCQREAFDAVLAHNAEAFGAALPAGRLARVPVVYVAHTLWRDELAGYLPARLRGAGASLGGRIDAACAHAAEAVLALSRRGAASLAPHARGPVGLVPPGLERQPAPNREAILAHCQRHGLEPDGFVVYAGNLDHYQDLPVLDAAAAQLTDVPCIVLTHDARGPALPHLRVLEIADLAETRALVHAARVAVLPRRFAGGFPIKLLHYMEAGRAIVAVDAVADTLVDRESGWLLGADYTPEELASGLRRCFADAELRRRLGAAARTALERRHDWAGLAEDTLGLVAECRAAVHSPRRLASGR